MKTGLFRADLPGHHNLSVIGLLLMTSFFGAGTGRSQIPEDKSASTIANSSSDWVDVSQSLGFPLGGLGTGYCAFGPYGFIHVNFDGRPQDGCGAGQWEYSADDIRTAPGGIHPSTFGFVLREGNTTTILQTNPAPWLPQAATFEHATATAFLPRGRVVFTDSAGKLSVQVDAFTPLLPHNLPVATLPVQIFDVTIANTGAAPRHLSLSLENSTDGQPVAGRADRTVFTSPTGQLAFAAAGGKTTARGVAVNYDLAPGARGTVRFYLAWYYPKVDQYRRYYTRDHPDASSILDLAVKQATDWSSQIDAWHASLDVPAYLKRLWFSSLSPVMGSTFMTTDPYFFVMETPHPLINTMDVFTYASWVYLINWPELERMDMDQYYKIIPTQGPDAGRVPHSLWDDFADYALEPTFVIRFRRDSLWFNDPAWTRAGYTRAVLAANRVYRQDNQDDLLVSKHGNQSYDLWPMPGISSYVNSAWVYGLFSLERTAQSLGQPAPSVGGEPVNELLPSALASYDRLLWNPDLGDWNLFYRTKGADSKSTPDSLFTDQLFGRWVLAIDATTGFSVLPEQKIHEALLTLYRSNLVEDPQDPARHFRGWVNSMKPGHIPDTDTGVHARTFWLGPQINLASLLGLVGEEKSSLDVIRSIERSLGSNELAGGEWNQSLNSAGQVIRLPDGFCKDTPRFAPYPRYSSAWEYLIRLIGLRMDEHKIFLKPFTSIAFNLEGVQLAGMALTVHVQQGWTRAEVDHHPVDLPVSLDRTDHGHEIDFLK